MNIGEFGGIATAAGEPGANLWREGMDTCVLNRSVGCLEDDTPRNMDGFISRIVKKGSLDAENESNLRRLYPGLVERGLLAIAIHQCTPKFFEQNRKQAANSLLKNTGPCKRLHNSADTSQFLNLITTRYDMSLYEYLTSHPDVLSDTTKLFATLRGALNALTAMVSDDSTEWMIHGDLHLDNVFVKLTGGPDGGVFTALGDWGRAIHIRDRNNPQTVFEDLTSFLSKRHKRAFRDLEFDTIRLPDGSSKIEKRGQYPASLNRDLDSFIQDYRKYNNLDAYIENGNEGFYYNAIDALRIYSFHSILNLLGFNDLHNFGSGNGLFYIQDQKQLIKKLNEVLGVGYIDLVTYAGQPVVGGAKKRKSKKTLRKRKQSRRR